MFESANIAKVSAGACKARGPGLLMPVRGKIKIVSATVQAWKLSVFRARESVAAALEALCGLMSRPEMC
ncbi:hypothetical protein EV130_1146 [Rhizobium azibense]|uniref:Uncharacterized protein n=1 Tax=Rhizobium azibense TaxID=1136135 RepID=A0A4R3RA00_9HYPH|nr:hypothetical protein EV130_1146 [Rhizobium azibense]TCU32148.1 hypothetical protein EV129_12298 [Rhizobium azibense]